MAGQFNGGGRQWKTAAASLFVGASWLAFPRFAACDPTPLALIQASPQSVVSSGPLTLTAAIESRVPEGQPAVLALTLHNTGAKVLTIGGSASEVSSFHLVLTDEAGRPVPQTVSGISLLTPPDGATNNSTVWLGPGKTLQYRFNLARLFDLSRPGVYTINAGRIFGPYLFGTPAPTPGMTLPPEAISLTFGALKFRMEESAPAQSGPVAYAPPSNHQTFLYMASAYNPGVVRYRIGANSGASFAYNPRPVGEVAAVSSPMLGSGPSSLVTTPNGRFLYAGGPSRDVPSQYTVSQYHIGNDGVLSPLFPPAVTVSLPTPQIPGPLLMDPKGRFLYSLAGALYAIGPQGHLTLTTTASWDKPLKNGSAVRAYWGVIDPTGTFLYVNGGPGGGFQINANGSLTPLLPFGTREPTPYHGNENALAFSPNSKFAFVGVSQSLNSAFFDLLVPMRVEKNGRLTPIQGAEQPVRTAVPPPNYSAPEAAALTIDPTGHFLVVMNPAYLDCYRIEADGRLIFLNMAQPESPLRLYSVFFVPGSPLVYVNNSNTSTLLSYRFDDKKGLVAAEMALPTSIPFEASIASASAPTPQRWGQPVAGLAISAHLPADTLPSNKPVVLTVTLQNTTAKPLSLGMVGADMTAFRLSLQARLLAAGRDLLGTPQKDKTPLILPPGGKRQYRFVLSRLADLTAGGAYTVQVTRTLPTGKIAASPVVPFMLNDPPQATRYGGKDWVLQVP